MFVCFEFGCGFLCLSFLVFTELFLDLWFGVWQYLGEISSHYCFKYYFCFFLFLLFPLCVCYTFYGCPTILGYSVLGFLHHFSICFCVLEVSNVISLSSEIVSSIMSSLLMSSPKAFLISVTVFWSLAFPFYSFLEFPSFCLHYNLFLYTLYVFH